MVAGGLYPGIFRLYKNRVRGNRFGDDVARSLPARTRAHVIADQNDHAAPFRRRLQEILGGDERCRH